MFKSILWKFNGVIWDTGLHLTAEQWAVVYTRCWEGEFNKYGAGLLFAGIQTN